MVVPGDVKLILMLGAILSVSESFHVDQKTIGDLAACACKLEQSRFPELDVFTKEKRKLQFSSTVDLPRHL
jgi:hypothetical protein